MSIDLTPVVKEEPAKDVPSLNQEYLPPVAEPVQAAAKGYPRENPPNPLKLDPQAATKVEVRVDSSTAAPMMMGGEIPGNAGTDYPIFDTIPETKFNCNDQATGGYYADVDEGRCQVSLSILFYSHSNAMPNQRLGWVAIDCVLPCDT